MSEKPYIGRFAPTPSGPLHFGSIIAALGSYLQARSQKGQWQVRIDDVDSVRARPGADKTILLQLEKLGLFWDGPIVFQSERLEAYRDALQDLLAANLVYACQCPRKQTANRRYPGTCREANLAINEQLALRIRTTDEQISFQDRLQDQYMQQLESDSGDFIIRRSDGLFAYHLAAVVDDAAAGITEIVRGADLLECTPAQIYLQQCLGLPAPIYLHLPVAIDAEGKKISKSDQAVPINSATPVQTLERALRFLGQVLPEESFSSVEELLGWAVKHWEIQAIPEKQTMPVLTD